MSNRSHGTYGQLICVTLLCIFAQPERLWSVLFVWFCKLEVCINATAVLRFGLEPAELSNEKHINCAKNSLKS